MNHPKPGSARIRVLLAEGDLALREALCRAVEYSPSLIVCGTARDGIEALERVRVLQPDVVVLDTAMPFLNGLEVLKHIMRYFPRPVIMLSSLTQHDAEMAIHALSLGAFDYLSKPENGSCLSDQKFHAEVIAKIQASVDRWAHRKQDAPRFRWPDSQERLGVVPEIIAIGASTGGPKALQELIPELPADLPTPIVIVQHMPPGFTGPFADRLNMLSALKAREARHDELLEAGTVYIAPAGRQFTVQRRSVALGQIVLSDPPGDLLHKPSVDAMMVSVAEVFGRHAMGVILTGMGSDGLHGMTAIRDAGGLTIGQDESTCTIYGMPRACAENGVLQEVLPLYEIPNRILKALRRSTGEHKLPQHAFSAQLQKTALVR